MELFTTILLVLLTLVTIGLIAYVCRPQRINVFIMQSFEYQYKNEEEKKFLFKKINEMNDDKNHYIKVSQSSKKKNVMIIKTTHPYAAFLLGYLLAAHDRDVHYKRQFFRLVRLRSDN